MKAGSQPYLSLSSNMRWLAHSRLSINPCQGNERDNAYGSALKVVKHRATLWDYGITFTSDSGKGTWKGQHPTEE